MNVIHQLALPKVIIHHINDYLGGETYWEARHGLTVSTAKLDVFSSDWWAQWHTYLKWYHWRKKHIMYAHDLTINSKRNIDTMLYQPSIPKRFHWILKNKEIQLLLRLYKVSISNPRMLHTLDTKLDILYNVWTSNASFYRNIVFE